MFGKRKRTLLTDPALLTDAGRAALAGASEEARELRHGYVSAEHLLLALLRPRTGPVADALRSLSVSPDRLRSQVKAVAPRGTADVRGALPVTSHYMFALDQAMAEARTGGAERVDVTHLFIGLARPLPRNGTTVAAQALSRFGITVDDVRDVLSGKDVQLQSLSIVIDDAADRSIYEQIVGQVQEAVATGGAVAGSRLPTVRQLADDLDIAPGTVARAWAELERLGVVVTDGARGTRVAERERPALTKTARLETLEGLLRPVVVAGFHLGATPEEVRRSLEQAMKDIFPERGAA